MRRGLRWLPIIGCLLSNIAAALEYAPPPPTIEEVRVGFNGRYKLGCWTPVVVAIESDGVAADCFLQLTTVDGDGVPCRYPSVKFQIADDGRRKADSLIRFGTAEPTLIIEVNSGHRQSARMQLTSETSKESSPSPLAAGEKLIVAVGPATTLGDLATGAAAGGEAARFKVARYDDAAQLPADSLAYDAVDAVYLAADQASRYASLKPRSPRGDALKRYLDRGGRVVIVGGPAALELLSSGGALAAFSPLNFSDPVALPRTNAVEEFVGGNKPVRAATAELNQLRVPRVALDTPVGRDLVVDLAEGDLPLIVRRAVGFGAVTWLLLDLEQPILREWTGRGVLLSRVLAPALQIADDPAARSKSTAAVQNNFGFGDLAGQLHQAIDQYPGVTAMPFYLVALMAIGYIALVAPLDYLLVHRVLRRAELTWLTFPLLVAAASGAAYATVERLKGTELRTNQVDVVDYDVAGGHVRGTSLAGVYSPTSAAYGVRIEPAAGLLRSRATNATSHTVWSAMSGEGLGGMHRRAVDSPASVRPYEFRDDALVGVPIAVRSSKLFTGDWTAESNGKGAQALTVAPDGVLAGSITNPCATALADVLVCHGTKAYKLGTLAAGENRDVRGAETRDLQSLLAGAQIVAREKRELSPGVRTRAHDLASLDVDEILIKILFYDVAGGRDHARLASDDLARLDFSELLDLNRAIVIGRIDDAPATNLIVQAEGREIPRAADVRHTVFRMVIPVEKAK